MLEIVVAQDTQLHDMEFNDPCNNFSSFLAAEKECLLLLTRFVLRLSERCEWDDSGEMHAALNVNKH